MKKKLLPHFCIVLNGNALHAVVLFFFFLFFSGTLKAKDKKKKKNEEPCCSISTNAGYAIVYCPRLSY